MVAGTLLAYSALQVWPTGVVPPAIAFTAAGLLIGTEGLGWLELSPDASSLRLLAEGALALVLFSDAARIDLGALRDGCAVPGAPARDRAVRGAVDPDLRRVRVLTATA